MAAFGGLMQTTKGALLQAKAQTGTKLNFTRIGVGDGELGGQLIPDLNGLVSEKMSLELTKHRVMPGGKAVIGATLSNKELITGFYFREIGVFALDPDDGEILYCYANAGAGAEFIPPASGPDIVEKQIDIITIVGSAQNVTAEIASAIYASTEEVEEHKTADAPHRYGGRFEWRYNPNTESLDLVVLE